jgi:predicted amidohydrolase YtcJ
VSDETADLIVVASAVHTMAGDTVAANDGPVAVLAVRDGLIAAAAGPDGARDLLAAGRGPGTVVLDDPGLVVLPAFVDTHNHLMLAAQNILGVPVSQAADIPGLVRLIKERAARTPPGQWIRTAADWHELRLAERRLPTAAELDEATTDHPVLLQRGGHNGVLNSAGLRRAGIGRDTPDLEGGFIDRDAAGEPRGVLGPEHAITRDEALRLYTVAGARFLGGAAGGALVPGAPADLVAFPADPFTCPDEQLSGLSPAVTVIGGRIAYQAGLTAEDRTRSGPPTETGLPARLEGGHDGVRSVA